MKTYTIAEQYENDINWFLVDNNDTIVSFFSAGSIVPKFIMENAELNNLLVRYFESLPDVCESIVNPNLNKYIDLNDVKGTKEQYLLGIGFYAKKGIYSFDKTNPCAGSHDVCYYLEASPTKPLSIACLPLEIRECLKYFKIGISLRDFSKIDGNYLPWANLFDDYYIEPTYKLETPKKGFLSNFF